jgi:NitT/TauT family transport system substrate-binding protein
MTYLSASRARLGVLLVAAGMVLSLCAIFAGAASAKKLQSLTIAYDPNPTNTSIVVAEQQGYFKKNGLNVKLTTSADTTALLPSVGKQFDLVGAGPSSILQFAAHGFHPMLVSAQTIENGTNLKNTYLIGASGVTSLKSLEGKTVGAAALSGTQYDALLWELKHAGISTSSVKVLEVPFADMSSDLASGTIQAALAINPFAAGMLAKGDPLISDPIAVTLHNQTAMSIGWVASGPWTVIHEQEITDFDKAQQEALAWMKAHTAGSQAILEKDFQLPAVAAEKYPITQYVSFKVLPTYLSAWIAPLKAIGVLPKSFDEPIGQLVYTG